MKGVTPEMLMWWFATLDSSTRFNGVDFSGPPVPVYRYWHLFDHIRFSWAHRVHDASGRLIAGSIVQIEENIGSVFPVRSMALVTRFDDEAFDFDFDLLGGRVRIGHLLHRYEQVAGGSSFYTEMLLGVDWPVGARFFNQTVAASLISEDFIRVWVLHKVEESRETERFAPKLFEHAREGSETRADADLHPACIPAREPLGRRALAREACGSRETRKAE